MEDIDAYTTDPDEPENIYVPENDDPQWEPEQIGSEYEKTADDNNLLGSMSLKIND